MVVTAAKIEAYAAALYAVGKAEGQLPIVADELFAFARAVETSDQLRDALSDPHLPAERRQQVVEELLGRRASDVTLGLVSMMVATGRGDDLPEVVDYLLELNAAEHGQEVAEVRTAVDLDAEQRQRLAQALERTVGHPVDLRVIVDPSVIGGLVVRVGDQVIDGSVRHRLAELREILSNP
jgi:F-type H+-transporting ATPase subunit delta